MMNAKFKKIISLLIVVLLTTTSIVKFEHHHKHHEISSKTDKNAQQLHEKCLICSFEFSVSLLNKIDLLSTKTEFKESFNIRFCKFYHSNYSNYSFLLRAPPLLTNSIN